MESDELSDRISALYRHVEDLRNKSTDDSNISDVLTDAFEGLQASLEELSTAGKELIQQNEELICASEEKERYLLEISRANEAMRRQSEMLNPSPVLIRGMDDRIITWSQGARKLYGYTADEALGNVSHELFKTEFPQPLEEIIDCVLRTGRWSGDLTHITRDGRRILVASQWVLYRDGSGTPSAIIEVNNDITERKWAYGEIQKSKMELDALIQSLDSGVALVDERGKFTIVNPAFMKMFGIREGESGIKNVNDVRWGEWQVFEADGRLLHVDDHPVRKAAMTGMPVRNRLVGVRLPTGGDLIWMQISAQPVLKPGGGIDLLICTYHDVTERRKAEEVLRRSRDDLDRLVRERTAELQNAKEELEVANEELQVANEELQLEIEQHQKLEADLTRAKDQALEAVQAKAAFLANMSHELRTPMNAVVGMTSILLDENLTPAQKSYVETIRSGGEAMLALISDLLDFTKVEKEKVALEHQPFSLRNCMEESLSQVSLQASEKGLGLSYTIKYGTPGALIGDPGRLRQVLVNLLSNAVKFTDEGEVSISVSSRAVEDGIYRILFDVRDTGIGIPGEALNKLFLPFSQVETTISRKRDGAGLGLAICKGIVELMGGEIWAQSTPSRGSKLCFTIICQAAKSVPADEKEGSKHSEILGEKYPLKILVAEDNPSNQRVLIEMLRRMGYRPDAAADGKEVLEAMDRMPYDLILMDVRMPVMDGLEATRQIRNCWSAGKQPRIVAITAYALEGDRERCMDAGMDGYIAKPVLKEELAMMLKRAALKSP